VHAKPLTEVSGRAPSVLLSEERQRLRPLKVDPRHLALRFPVLVGPRAAVVHEGVSYTMPPEAVGLIGMLHLFPDRVAIIAGRYEATHPRNRPSAYIPVEPPSAPAPSGIPNWTPPSSTPGAGLSIARTGQA